MPSSPVLRDRDPSLPLVPGPSAIFFVGIAVAVPFLGLLPIAAEPGPKVPGLIALFASGFLLTGLSTSFLLFARFREACTWSLLLLCCAYFYSGLMTIPHLLTFPGAVLSDQSLIVTSGQSAAWIYLLWTGGFALLTFFSVVLEAWFSEHRIASKKFEYAAVIGLCTVLIAVIVIAVTVVAKIDSLPPMVTESKWTVWALVGEWSVVVLLGAGIAVILLAIRERNRLYLWLSLSLETMMLANALTTAGGGRFTIGFTVARLAWLASACVLFVYLLVLSARQHRLLARAADLLQPSLDDTGPHGGSRIQPENWSAVLDTFVARENIARYKRMLEPPNDEATRQLLLRLLADEERKLKRYLSLE
jgi:hypothetical protein